MVSTAAPKASPGGEGLPTRWPPAAGAGSCASTAFPRPPAGDFSRGEEFPKRAGGCGPRSPVGPRGVHPRKRHCPGRYAPPGCPVPYCLPLPGFARASRIGLPLRLQNFPQRPHGLPWNAGWMLHTADFLRNLSIFAVGACIAHPNASVARMFGLNRPACGGFGPMKASAPTAPRDCRPEPAAFGDSLPESLPGRQPSPTVSVTSAGPSQAS